jgi:hypothetical protein
MHLPGRLGRLGRIEIKNKKMVLHNDVKNGLENFSPPTQPTAEPVAINGDPICPTCLEHPASRHWQPLGQSTWLCETCRPPPSPRMIARWLCEADEPVACAPSLVEPRASGPEHRGAGIAPHPMPLHITNYEQPACPHCGCRWIAEHVTHTVATGDAPTLQCWSCKRPISQDDLFRELLNPKPLPAIKHHRHRAVYARESGCVNIVPCR